MTSLEWALAYARRGYHVFPLKPNSKEPLGKLVPHGHNDATTDPVKINDWWGAIKSAGIGINLHASGCVAIDEDPRNGGDIRNLPGRLPRTVVQRTGGGGRHFLFRHPGGRLRGKLATGIDLKDRGYIVVEPSIHPDTGAQYEWEVAPGEVQPADMPDWLLQLARAGQGETSTGVPQIIGEVIPKGSQHYTLVSFAGTMRQRGATYDEILPALLAMNQRCEEPGPRENIEQIARTVSGYSVREGEDINAFTAQILKSYVFRSGDGQAGTTPEPAYLKFWYSEDGSSDVKINHSYLVDFWQERGYGKMYILESNTSSFIKRTDRILERVSSEQIKDATLRYAEGLGENDVLGKLRRGSNVFFSRYLLECISPLKPDLQKDSREAAFYYFLNGWVRVTADDIEFLSYKNLDHFIWKDQIIKRNFHFVEDNADFNRSEFGRFIWNIARGSTERVSALGASIGYMLHGYKNPSVAKAICFVDEAWSDVPAGRTGKGLVMRACGQIVPTMHVDARNFRFDGQFSFQGIVPGVTRIVHFSDASKNFPFERLFALITDDMPVEEKGRPRVIIPFEQSPKFAITTNYIIEGYGGSHEDRIHEIEFSDHYNKNHKPKDEFGHLFFDGWNDAEWNLFYNLMLRFVQLYLRDGLLKYQHVNLETKKLVQMTCPEFFDFIELVREEVQPGEFEMIRGERFGAISDPSIAGDEVRRIPYEYDKKEQYLEFCEMYPEVGCEQRDFTRWLKSYAQFQGWEIQERRTNSGKERKIWFVTQCDAGVTQM